MHAKTYLQTFGLEEQIYVYSKTSNMLPIEMFAQMAAEKEPPFSILS